MFAGHPLAEHFILRINELKVPTPARISWGRVQAGKHRIGHSHQRGDVSVSSLLRLSQGRFFAQ
jgi:hypothetical protein